MNHVPRRGPLGRSAICLAVTVCAVATLASTGGASASEKLDLIVKEPDQPAVELVRPKKSMRFVTGNLHTAPFLTTNGTPLEIWAHRPQPGAPAVVDSIDRRLGQPVATPVPGLEATMNNGLSDFLKYRILNSKGKVVAESSEPLCPNGIGTSAESSWSSGAGAAGVSGVRKRERPVLPSWWGLAYPCGEEQADSLVWLFGRGNPTYYFGASSLALPDGEYTYEATVNPDGVLPEKTLANNRYTQRFTLISDRERWRDLTYRSDQGGQSAGAGASRSGAAVSSVRSLRSRTGPPNVLPPKVSQISGPDGALPDPMALPASKFAFLREGSRTQLSFSSIVSNAGEAPILLFGKRRERASRSMPGWQYTKGIDGKLVKEATNGFVWDNRDTHLHWHYNKLAVYELLSMDGTVLRRSDKVGFCFMPTTLLRFFPTPGPIGTGAPSWYENGDQQVDCGRRRSGRVAMSLPPGWGDEYYQAVAGQSLDVTDLGPGSYRLRITVNPEGDLAESDPGNNVSERLIKLGGRGTDRTLTVPRQGIVSPEFHPLERQQDVSPFGGYASSAGAGAGAGAGAAAPGSSRLFCSLR